MWWRFVCQKLTFIAAVGFHDFDLFAKLTVVENCGSFQELSEVDFANISSLLRNLRIFSQTLTSMHRGIENFLSFHTRSFTENQLASFCKLQRKLFQFLPGNISSKFLEIVSWLMWTQMALSFVHFYRSVASFHCRPFPWKRPVAPSSQLRRGRTKSIV